jgi:Phospholipase_D-nuclease N-terminal
MIDAEGIVAVAFLLFWIWALLDCIATDSAMVRNLPKLMWILLVLILSVIGALAWLLLGRPEKADRRPGSSDYTSRRRPVGVEDSPRYSSTPIITDRRSRELDAELERWERQQRERGESTSQDPESSL